MRFVDADEIRWLMHPVIIPHLAPRPVDANRYFGTSLSADDRDEQRLSSILDVVAPGLNIRQVRAARSRMAGEPPDAIISSKLARLGLQDFHQAHEAIEAGRRSVESCLPALKELGLLVFYLTY